MKIGHFYRPGDISDHGKGSKPLDSWKGYNMLENDGSIWNVNPNLSEGLIWWLYVKIGSLGQLWRFQEILFLEGSGTSALVETSTNSNFWFFHFFVNAFSPIFVFQLLDFKTIFKERNLKMSAVLVEWMCAKRCMSPINVDSSWN